MRRIVIAVGTTLTGLVLLFSWPTSLNRPVTAGGVGPAGTGTGATGASGSAASGTSSSSTTAAPASTPVTATYDGGAVATPYGDVQVRITVTDGVVAAADALSYPHTNGRDQQINGYAIPILNSEVLTAQSAGINMVSGASYTSNGYVRSLQDALDQAGL